MSADQDHIEALLREGLPPLLARADGARLRLLADGFVHATPANLRDLPIPDEDTQLRLRLLMYLRDVLVRRLQALVEVNRCAEEFSLRYARATTDLEKHAHLLTFARDLGSSDKALKQDRKALKRWLADDALLGRSQRQAAAHERLLALALDRIGLHGRRLLLALSASLNRDELQRCWRRLDLEPALLPLFAHTGDARVRVAAFRSLGQLLSGMPADMQPRAVGAEVFRLTYSACMDHRSPVWVTVEALRTLLPLAPQDLIDVLIERLTRPSALGDRDEIFVRRRAVRVLGFRLANPLGLDPARLRAMADLLRGAAGDASPLVRQGVVQALTIARPPDSAQLLRTFALIDDAPSVRGAALLACLELVPQPPWLKPILQILQGVLAADKDRFVLRTVLHVVRHGHRILVETHREDDARQWQEGLGAAIEKLHAGAPDLAVRRFAAQTQERLWLQAQPERLALLARLTERLRGVPAGAAVDAADLDLDAQDPHTLGRVLALLAEDGHGLELEPGQSLRRGHRFGFKMWRALHEWRNPDTAKRQAHRHTIARVFRGSLRAPSAVLSELSETKVPGEPLFIPAENGWRNYLPLADEALSSLRARAPVRLYTSEGVTRLTPPQHWRERLRAWWKLSWDFAGFARLRNWRETDALPPSAYVAALQALGFRLEFTPHGGDSGAPPAQAEPAVARFFAAPGREVGLGSYSMTHAPARSSLHAVVPAPLLSLWEDFGDYFVSLYQNTLRELFTFLVVMAALFLGRHYYFNRAMRKARASIPLVIGGWGSRGKSGTERLKAALISALGYNSVSKTTGCEAMFLHGYAYGPLREMFLFRPYDKATIWEQVFVMRVAQRLGTEVFMWECMGLTPSYVNILQKQWMRDDLATLTNTYPDHEDIQGPAGINIPQVMTEFIPENSTLLTSEEQMLPILRDAAATLGTRVRSVGWLEAGLIPADVMSRFPYEEHPYNLALVTALAEELGLEPDYAWKEMADRVVPDLGALKAYPTATRRGRRLEYILGNSANERLASLGNWVRMGLDRADAQQQPGVFISTLVNNRADRVARSRVFASMLVNDTPADLHFIIGSNVTGFYAFVKEEWATKMATVTLWPSDGTPPREVLNAAARRLRVAVTAEDVAARLRAMLEGVAPALPAAELAARWREPEAVAAALPAQGIAAEIIQQVLEQSARFAAEYQTLENFARKLEGATRSTALDQEFQALLWTWFNSRIYIFHDFHASANQIIEIMCEHTPPGYKNRIMGMQNIKGTGLGHVYAWEAWESCHRACANLQSGEPARIQQGLRALSQFQSYNLLCSEHLARVLKAFRHSAQAQSEPVQAALKLIEAQFAAATTRLHAQAGVAAGRSRWARLADAIESFLDAGDAVKRRKQANRIYRDLADERIGHARAALELQKLNERQQGGWLWARIERALKPAADAP